MTAYRCELAVLPGGEVAEDVLVEVVGGRISAVRPIAADADDDAGEGGLVADPDAGVGPVEERGVEVLHGLVLPGFANAHSHAFHRALRGRTHDESGTFWTWRERMYAVAERLEPESLLALARATYAEMALAGYAAVGEFHYLHHAAGGIPYPERNAMGLALVQAAREAGIRIALLDACYLTGGIDQPLTGVQQRFGDADAKAWGERVDALAADLAGEAGVVVGAAVHSVRAVPREDITTVAAWAAARELPLHVHVSEQPAENAESLEAYAATPTGVLEEVGALGPLTTAVHGTHLTDGDVAALGATATHVCFCPTTERDLADGVGPARALLDAGARLTLGSDGQTVIDGLAEARALEMNVRLATGRRGQLGRADLLAALTEVGHASLGFPDAGVLQVGARADLVAVRLGTVRTATGRRGGPTAALDLALHAASADDVTDVVVDGQRVVRDGAHVLGDVARLLAEAIDAVDAAPPDGGPGSSSGLGRSGAS